ncbi:hypothetical protein ACHAQI_008962 [Fusarium lateritium]
MLAYGGCICVPSEDERVNDLSGAIVRMGVNTLNLTPSVARLLNPQDMPCVKNLSVGGETITNELLESWASHVVFTNVYGPAECIVACTYKKSLRIDDELNNIGKPLGSVLWVVDPKDHDILYPIGCVGELVIGGPGLAKCYTDRDLTNKSFIESPLWASNFRDIGQYTRFYKTGDLVKYKSDGDLVYIGRKDMQIKPGQGDRNKSNSENLRHPLKTLASYMVPQTWLAVDPLPLSAIGKLDRLRVKQLLLQEDVFVNYNVSQDQYGDSSTLLTDTEKSLQSLWSDVLNLPTESIDANSNFLELGGNSLKAMRLVALARRKKMRISLASIFQGPVLAAMATCVDAVRTRVKNKRVVSHAEDDAVQTMQHFELVGGEVAARDMFTAESHLLQHDLVWVDVYDMYPCTPLQAGLIALSAKYSGAHTLHNVWELSQSIDVSRFKAAWKACVRDNAILRTMIIPSADFGPCQVILKPESSRRSNLWQRKGKSISLDDYFKRDLSDAISCGSLLNRFAFAQDGKYFVWTCHHSGYDAVSMVLIIQAVERRYHEESSRTQRTQAVAPSIANLIRHIHTSDPQASQEWWQSYLRGATPAKFPQILAAHDPYADARMRTQASISRPSVNSNRSGIVSATIVRAAWALVLGRYSDTLDIVFGVTLGGRTADVVDIDSIVGPTATTLPVRVKIDPQETDRAYLERVQAKSTAMIAFEHVGIPKIAVIGPEYRAVCDLNSLLVIQAPGTNAIVELLGMPRLDLNNDNTTQATRSDVPSYALSIDAELGDSMANITITHDSQLISGPQISRMAGQFVHVIEQLSAGSASTAGELSVGDVDLVTEQDLAQLAIWNKTMPPARDTTVTADMAQWVEHDAMAPAVCAWDAELNYGELDKAADRMARLLTDMGIGANTVVPVCFDKSAWVVVAVLGILRAGSAYVALDPSHPQNRLEGIIADVDASVIVAAPQHAARFSMLPDIRVVAYTEAFVASLIGEYTDIDTSFSHLTPSPPSPASPAFILFSSGTAGRPKGIVVEHNAVCTKHERLNDMAGAIRRLRANYVSLTPSVASLLRPADVPQLKTLVLGGEAPTPENVRTWAPCLNLIICYGPAECSITCSGTDPAILSSDPSDVGHALGCRMWIVDPTDHNRLAPVGCVGEILVEGSILARGYLKDDEKTTAAFIEGPAFIERFSGGSRPRRFYKTGDLGYYRPEFDGSIGFAGRKDTQVKVRGQRVELGEIEYHIYARTEVQHVVATVPSAGPLKSRLASLLVMADNVVPQSDANHSRNIAIQSSLSNQDTASFASNISDYLADRLPRYMIPAVFIFVTRIPFNTSGKLDRKQVQAWVNTMDDATYQLVTKATEIESQDSPLQPSEELLLQICGNVLKVDPASIRLSQSFLSLGGDSITAMLVVSRSRSEGMVVSVKDILRSKTLHKLAALMTSTEVPATAPRLSQQEPIHDTTLPVAVSRDNHDARLWRSAQEYLGLVDLSEIEAMYPCTPVQTGILMAHARNPRYYEVKNVFEVKSTVPGGPVDIDLLEQAWRDLADRQPALRTVFFEIPSEHIFHQAVIKGRNNTVVQRIDLTENGDEDSLVQYFFSRQTINYYTHTPANQLTIGVTSSGRVLIKVDILHALSDGTMWNLIFQELSQAYGNKRFVEQPPAPLYSDYVTYLASQPSQVALEYWQGYLAGVRPCMFPTIRGDDNSISNSNGFSMPTTQIAFVDFHRGTELQSLCAKHGLTISNMIQTVWSIVLRSFVGCDEVCFGYVVSGRDVPLANVEQAIGTYIGQLPCRIHIQDKDSVTEVAQKLQDDFSNGLSHQHMSMVDLYHSLPGVSGQLFNTNVHYMRTPNQETHEPPMIQFEYKHSIDPSEARYWDSALSEPEAQNLADLLNSTLVRIMEDIERPVASLGNIPVKPNSSSPKMSSSMFTPPANPVIAEGIRNAKAAEASGIKRPLSSKEEGLRQAWIDVLEVNPDTVTHTTSLRPLGVDSYLAIQIVRRVQDFGLELKFSDALSGMNLASMAARLTPTIVTQGDASQSTSVATSLSPTIGILNYSSNFTDSFDSHSSNADNGFHSGEATTGDSRSNASAEELGSVQAPIEKIPSGILIELTPDKPPLATVVMEPFHSAGATLADELRDAPPALFGSVELGWETIEHLVPVTPVQQAMLESQQRLLTPNLYVPRAIWRVNGLTKTAGSKKLIEAWQSVVNTHACLRTVFVRTVTGGDGRYHQLVLKKADTYIQHLEARSEYDALKLLVNHVSSATGVSQEQGLRPAHVLTLCHITGSDQDVDDGDQFIFDLSISHALSDAVSSAVILRQLAAICGNTYGNSGTFTPLPSSAPYSDIQRPYNLRDILSRNDGKEYWISYLKNSEPCYFPRGVNTSATTLGKVGKVSIHFERLSELKAFTMSTGITASTFFRTAWAMLLARWLGRADVCFGYVVSGRDASVPGIEEIVGPVLNILPCRVNVTSARKETLQQGLSEKTKVEEAMALELLLDKMQTDLFESLPHQLSSSTFVDNATRPESSMFNTLVNFRNSGLSKISQVDRTTQGDYTTTGTESVFSKIEEFEVLWYEDAMDFDIILAVGEGKDKLDIDLNYWDGRTSHETVDQVGQELLLTLHTILDTCGGTET